MLPISIFASQLNSTHPDKGRKAFGPYSGIVIYNWLCSPAQYSL